MILGGGIDVGSIYVVNEGILMMIIGVMLWYMYFNVLVFNVDDYENFICFVIEIVCLLNDESYKNIMW